jgi:prephenate dehydrogenase
MRVALLGLGLIGGSIARALRRDPGGRWSVIAWTPSGTGPVQALREGVIDDAAGDLTEALEGAELVILAAPAPAGLALLDELAGPSRSALADQAVITDVASTKREIVERARLLGLRFVGGHPMAGRDTSGFAAATPDLFDDRPWVIVTDPADGVGDDDIACVERLALACGARPVRLDAAAHDEAVAAISHLPLVVAAALVEAVAGRDEAGATRAGPDDWPLASSLAASGWRDTTRLARGEPTMGAGILATNAAPVASRIRELVAVLESWAADLERPGGPDETALAERLRSARDRVGGSGR